MPITLGNILINEISGPVSCGFITPTDKIQQLLQIDTSPMLLFGDNHENFEQMCSSKSGNIVSYDCKSIKTDPNLDINSFFSSLNCPISLSLIDPLFFRILDSLGSEKGNIDYYVEDWFSPKWLNSLSSVTATNIQINNNNNKDRFSNIMYYLPTQHFECFSNPNNNEFNNNESNNNEPIKRCFTNYIRYHYIDVRNTDFTLNTLYSTLTPNDISKLEDSSNEKKIIKEIEMIYTTNQNKYSDYYKQINDSFQDYCNHHKLSLKSDYSEFKLINNHTDKINDDIVIQLKNNLIKNRNTMNIQNYFSELSWETILHDKLIHWFKPFDGGFFGYDSKDLLTLSIYSKQEFLSLLIDFDDKEFKERSLIYKQLKSIERSQEYNFGIDFDYQYWKKFIIDYCLYQYQIHSSFFAQLEKDVLNTIQNIHYIIDNARYCHSFANKFLPSSASGDSFILNKELNNESINNTIRQFTIQYIVTLLCPLLDLYCLFRCWKQYETPSILKVVHAGSYHIKNIIQFLIDKGYYKKVFFKENTPSIGSSNTPSNTSSSSINSINDILKLYSTAYKQPNYRCILLQSINNSIDDTILDIYSNKTLIKKRIYNLGITLYLRCLNGQCLSNKEIDQLTNYNKKRKKELFTD